MLFYLDSFTELFHKDFSPFKIYYSHSSGHIHVAVFLLHKANRHYCEKCLISTFKLFIIIHEYHSAFFQKVDLPEEYFHEK